MIDLEIVRTLRETGSYHSPPIPRAKLAYLLGNTGCFYARIWRQILLGSGRFGKQGDHRNLILRCSANMLRAAEAIGVQVHITGLEHLAKVPGGCVVAANHMGSFDSLLLPLLMWTFKPASSWVIKGNLLRYPFMGALLAGSGPIAVTRTNAREDLRKVLEQGQKVIASGGGVFIFPQSTRMAQFEPEQYHTLAIKLAKRNGVPLLPLALDTSFWPNGRIVKDLSRVTPNSHTWFEMGPPIDSSDEKAAHQQNIAFIQERLAHWQKLREG